jgi:hypothetical protein
MHPAHRTVGVLGTGVVTGPYCRIENSAICDMATMPMQVVLAASTQDVEAHSSLRSFEQAIHTPGNIECRRVKLETVDTGSEDLANADCVIVFGQGLHMACHWSNFDATRFTADKPETGRDKPTEIEISPAAEGHPLLNGVDPFVSRRKAPVCVPIPADATVLLTVATSAGVYPVAWVGHRRHGRTFHTTLGSPEDFQQPAFVRLLLNALAWIRP